jgi:uncharacterized protein involved in outer membrane biogenesis
VQKSADAAIGLLATSQNAGRRISAGCNMNKIFTALIVLFITIVSALFAVPYFVDWNRHRDIFEQEATRLLGREVRVVGPVNLRLLPFPYLSFDKIRVAGAPGESGEAFFRADALTVRLSVPPLLRGVVEASEIEVKRPTLRLAVTDKSVGSWPNLSRYQGTPAYLPNNLALEAVRISDGTLTLQGQNGAELKRFEKVNGEFSAPALEGPYRFRGTFEIAGAERELRVATAIPEADGTVRFKASLRLAESGSLFALDGRATDLGGHQQVAGELTAQILTPGKQVGGATSKRRIGEFDLRATLTADSTGASASDLAVSFDSDGRPQLVSGTVTADWRERLKVEARLSSYWLDLDRIVGAGEPALPLDVALSSVRYFIALLPLEANARASLSVDQANLAGDALNSLQVAIARTGSVFEIEGLRAGLPGSSRLELTGSLSGPSEAPLFSGDVSLRGASIARFSAWLSGRAHNAETKSDSGFGFRSRLNLEQGRVVAHDIVGELADTAIAGEASYRWQGHPELTVSLQGARLDTSAILPTTDLADLIRHLMGATGETMAGTTITPTFDVMVGVRISQLVTAQRTFRDVVAELQFKGGALKVPVFRISGEEGYGLEFEGEVQDVVTRPKGALRGVMRAETAEAFDALAQLLDLPIKVGTDSKRLGLLVPLRLAGSAVFGARMPASTDIALDGEASGMRTHLEMRLDGSIMQWRAAGVDLTASIETVEAAKLTGLLLGERSGPDHRQPLAQTQPGRGRLLIKATGIPGQRINTLATLASPEIGLQFRGQAVLADTAVKIDGDIELNAADAGRLAGPLRLPSGFGLDKVPITGKARIAIADGLVRLEWLAFDIAGKDVTGSLTFATAGDRRSVEGRLKVGDAEVAALLLPLLDQRLAGISAAKAAVVDVTDMLWPDEPFEFALFDQFEGQVQLEARRLTLAGRASLSPAVLKVTVKSGRLETALEGTGMKGKWTGAASLERSGNFIIVTGMLHLTDGSLESMAVDNTGRPRLTGPVQASLTFHGQGATPRDLVASLQGSGTLDIGEASLAHLSPDAALSAVERAFNASVDNMAPVLVQTLSANLAAATLPLGPRQLALELTEGTIHTQPLVVETVHGSTTGQTRLNLQDLRFASDWRIALPAFASREGASTSTLPPILIAHSGFLGRPDSVAGQIDTGALERELMVRKMEHDVDELEGWRRNDEQRALGVTGVTPASSKAGPETHTPVGAKALPDTPLAPAVPDRRRSVEGKSGVSNKKSWLKQLENYLPFDQ